MKNVKSVRIEQYYISLLLFTTKCIIALATRSVYCDTAVLYLIALQYLKIYRYKASDLAYLMCIQKHKRLLMTKEQLLKH